jgi:hypothetical protein
MSHPVTGRCFCKRVRFQADHPPVAVRACWCRDCQYLSAGNASVNAILRTEGFACTGDLGEYVSQSDSGNRMRRRFCRNCGTPLFSESASRPHLIIVRVGALDDPEIARPTGVIWSASAPDWGWGLAELPRTEGQPPPVP